MSDQRNPAAQRTYTPHADRAPLLRGLRPAGRARVAQRQTIGMVLRSLRRLGGVEYLAWLAREHPPEYVRLLLRVIPQQVQVEADVGSSSLEALVEASRTVSVPVIDVSALRAADAAQAADDRRPALLHAPPDGAVEAARAGLAAGAAGFAAGLAAGAAAAAADEDDDDDSPPPDGGW